MAYGRLPPGSGRFQATNGGDPVDRAVERCDRLDAGGFRVCDQVSLGEVDPLDLVDLERAQKQRLVDDDDGGKRHDRANELCDTPALELVEGLENVDDLRDDQVGY